MAQKLENLLEQRRQLDDKIMELNSKIEINKAAAQMAAIKQARFKKLEDGARASCDKYTALRNETQNKRDELSKQIETFEG